MVLKKGLITNLLLLFMVLFSFSCNAPRDNPLDPYSPKSELAQIEGTVQPLSAPFSGIPDVTVFWVPGNIVTQTDNSGKFVINNIKPVDGKLIFSKTGYTSDTLFVKWNNTKIITTSIVNLNKIPTLESYSIYTEVSNSSTPSNSVSSQSANLIIKVKINDSDNDIDSVYVKNDMINFTGGLELQGKIYQGTFSTSRLNINDIEEIVGYNFDVRVIDKSKRVFLIGSNKVARVIKTGTDAVYPVNNDTISVPVNLTWNQFNAGYPFTYRVEIYNASPQLVFTQDNIESSKTSLTIDTTAIGTGDYFWAILVVDKFSDSYKSIPGRFHIK